MARGLLEDFKYVGDIHSDTIEGIKVADFDSEYKKFKEFVDSISIESDVLTEDGHNPNIVALISIVTRYLVEEGDISDIASFGADLFRRAIILSKEAKAGDISFDFLRSNIMALNYMIKELFQEGIIKE